MYQAIETTEARTVWVSSDAPEFGMGFLRATRVEVILNPDGVSDWNEPGSAYQCNLMSGLWPDKHDIALMVLGYSPDSQEADTFLAQLAELDLGDNFDWKASAYERLLKGVRVMPVWGNATTRMVFVTGAFMRGTAKDDAPNLNRTGPGAQRPAEMAFDHWKLMLDLELKKRGLPFVDDATLTDDKLRKCHSSGMTIKDTANAIESTRLAQGSEPVDARPDAAD